MHGTLINYRPLLRKTTCTSVYFLKFHTHLEVNSAMLFKNVFSKCSRVLNLVFFKNGILPEHRHILHWGTYYLGGYDYATVWDGVRKPNKQMFWKRSPDLLSSMLDENCSIAYLEQTFNLRYYEWKTLPSLHLAPTPTHMGWDNWHAFGFSASLSLLPKEGGGKEEIVTFLVLYSLINWWIVAIMNQCRFINFSIYPHVRWIWSLRSK